MRSHGAPVRENAYTRALDHVMHMSNGAARTGKPYARRATHARLAAPGVAPSDSASAWTGHPVAAAGTASGANPAALMEQYIYMMRAASRHPRPMAITAHRIASKVKSINQTRISWHGRPRRAPQTGSGSTPPASSRTPTCRPTRTRRAAAPARGEGGQNMHARRHSSSREIVAPAQTSVKSLQSSPHSTQTVSNPPTQLTLSI